ncbi:hypothetical protein CEUSTIGMA_g291.t1 [Chlamydomonas eustigma]|uniref:Vacuolar cation/proton exchanger n=1 Tax=Chlamydomonas eustigma TaxID=1157962 RepID=A0A250WQ54_9CHLO|nr:hypothetical protein CEUSTIGMA_g291.t1 [Chlamydomonas eustigma]|eukprot:GAX72836.1 hypothetical protein CEUSTIGMA_g291.t1 [Chlamydomonas eustigma]
MVNTSLKRAICVIRAAVRMKMLTQRSMAQRAESIVSIGDNAEDTHRTSYELPSESATPLEQQQQLPLLTSNSWRRTESVKLSIGRTWEAEARLVGRLLSSSYLSVLLLFIPLGIAGGFLHWNPQLVFGLNLVSLIPLALVLGDVTEDLAQHYGDVIGGLLNATFGNVVEVILAVSALYKGLTTVVAASLLGSILSNLLLVLGFSMLIGGMFNKTQSYNTQSTQAHSTLLFLAVLGIAIPTSASQVIPDITEEWIMDISHVSAIVMLCCYICYLFFQLVTHPEGSENGEDANDDGLDAMSHHLEDEEVDDGGGPGVPDILSVPTALGCLAVISVLVALHCEFVTDKIETVSSQTGISQSFIGMIILPIAGNACEHVAAVLMAAKNKMDLSLGIAVGSSLQISLFAIPFVVLVGWVIQVKFSLEIDLFALLAMMFSVIHANLVIATGRSNWLTGVTLIAVYILIATTYFYRE